MKHSKTVMEMNNLLGTIKTDNLKMVELQFNNQVMYGIKLICDCHSCNGDGEFLVIAPLPTVAMKMLIQATTNIQFVVELKQSLDKFIAEMN